MIKAGQIYENKKEGYKYAVYQNYNPNGFWPDEIIITMDCRPKIKEPAYWTKDEILIAEYKTYEEAVNSKEFNQ